MEYLLSEMNTWKNAARTFFLLVFTLNVTTSNSKIIAFLCEIIRIYRNQPIDLFFFLDNLCGIDEQNIKNHTRIQSWVFKLVHEYLWGTSPVKIILIFCYEGFLVKLNGWGPTYHKHKKKLIITMDISRHTNSNFNRKKRNQRNELLIAFIVEWNGWNILNNRNVCTNRNYFDKLVNKCPNSLFRLKLNSNSNSIGWIMQRVPL